ncbi:hypothetical protein [Natronococcus zhouii]|uniref:hypothetical protein n=1 Tax=Natronococcus zhouii TaxID=2951804 RepID=UPI00207D6B64|nr:hypothetical protein [Natronococcus sp. CG52]
MLMVSPPGAGVVDSSSEVAEVDRTSAYRSLLGECWSDTIHPSIRGGSRGLRSPYENGVAGVAGVEFGADGVGHTFSFLSVAVRCFASGRPLVVVQSNFGPRGRRLPNLPSLSNRRQPLLEIRDFATSSAGRILAMLAAFPSSYSRCRFGGSIS